MDWLFFVHARQMNQETQIAKRRRVRAFLLSDRIDTANLEHDGVVSTTPVTYRFGKDGFVTLFLYSVVVSEKADVVWARQDLDRLYARLEDEYELKERAEALSRKLAVIADTAEILTDTIDTRRSLRLEIIIVVLIAVELVIAGFQVLY